MKEIIATRIDFNADEKEVKRYVYYRAIRDSLDNVLEETEFDEDTGVIHKWVYKFTESGELIESVKYGPSDELIERQTEIKDENNDVVKSLSEFGDGTMMITEFVRGDTGLVEEEIITNEEGDLLGRKTYLMDRFGNTKATIETDPDGNELSKVESSYNENSMFPYEDRYYTDGKLEFIEITKYNDQGYWTEILRSDPDNTKIEHTVYEYDKLMNVTKKTIRNFKDDSERIEESVYANKHKLVLFTIKINGYPVHEKKVTYDQTGKKICDEIWEKDYDGRFLSHIKCIYETRDI